jgi:hypothetical protein
MSARISRPYTWPIVSANHSDYNRFAVLWVGQGERSAFSIYSARVRRVRRSRSELVATFTELRAMAASLAGCQSLMVWLDVDGGKDKIVGVHYPLGVLPHRIILSSS